MKAYPWCILVVSVLASGLGQASTLTLEIVPTSNTVVTPGGSVDYRIIGVVSNDDNLGLAVFGVDVLTNTGVTQPQANAGPSMDSFVKNAGLTNPAGFGGTVSGDNLLQIGGAQNTIGNDGIPPNPEYPAGTVVQGIAIGTPVVLANGTITAPPTIGIYSVTLANAFGNVLTEDKGSFFAVEAATASVGDNDSFQIEVWFCGDGIYEPPIGDLNTDCSVDWADLGIFTAHWLWDNCSAPDWCQGADLHPEGNPDGVINLADFGVFAGHWLESTRPGVQPVIGYLPRTSIGVVSWLTLSGLVSIPGKVDLPHRQPIPWCGTRLIRYGGDR